mmetsp:Transcript_64486/g.155924  ORF Transcript_64486/g.155924 Transcript_64486/m.155924 type:complete len:141 (+) Transcript_64486:74-496(+)
MAARRSSAMAALLPALLLLAGPAAAWDERDDAFEDSSLGEMIAADDLAAQFSLSEPDLDGSDALSLLQATALLHHKDRRDSAAAGLGLGPRGAQEEGGRAAAALMEADEVPSEGVALVQTQAKVVRPRRGAKLGKREEEL